MQEPYRDNCINNRDAMNSSGTSNSSNASKKIARKYTSRDARNGKDASKRRNASNSMESAKQIHMSHHMTKSFTLHHFHVLVVTNSVSVTCTLQ